METKKLSFEQMENLEGGWSWTRCLMGATASVSTGLAAYATAVAGPAGTLLALAGGCVLNNVL